MERATGRTPISHAALIDRLARAATPPLVSVVAPAGYGKTAMLARWAERDGRRCAWVTLREQDNDPDVLLQSVAEALAVLEPLSPAVSDVRRTPAEDPTAATLSALCSALASISVPTLLVVDDVQVLRSAPARGALSMLADHVPAGSALVLAGRTAPPVRVARLRSEGRLVEIGPSDLALTPTEAGSLLRAAGVVLDEAGVAEVHHRTEGWLAGLDLAALSLRVGGSSAADADPPSGHDLFVYAYVESEFLADLTSDQRSFLTATSVLDRMSGPLCDSVLEASGSGATLAELAASNMLLVPLDHRGEWYRYHPLLRDLLRAELDEERPGLARILCGRAASWYEHRGEPDVAVGYAIRAEDVAAVARTLSPAFGPSYLAGRAAALRGWIAWLEEHDGLDPVNVVHAGLLAALTGQVAEAERWAGQVDDWSGHGPTSPADPYRAALAAALRALLCRKGPAAMRSDADEAARRFAEAGHPAPLAALLQGTARLLSGETDTADRCFAEAGAGVDEGSQTFDRRHERHVAEFRAMGWCERAWIAMARHQWPEAEWFVDRAQRVLAAAGRTEGFAGALTCALRARAAAHRGDVPSSRRELDAAHRLRALMTQAQPHWAVQCRLALARVHQALGDLPAALGVVDEIDDILAARPALGALVDDVEDLRTTLLAARDSRAEGAPSLTAAELRLLPLLATNLTYREIADALLVSTHTIRTQTRSLFAKLDARTRSAVVARCLELGLLEG